MTDPLLLAIAERFGTPTYVYDLDEVDARLASLRRALPGAALRYAVKANPNGALLRHLAGGDVGAEVITRGELERALRAGMIPATQVLGGPRQDPPLVARAAELGVGLVSLDGERQWDHWRAYLELTPTRFLVRVNPGLDPHTHEHLATGAASSKFGLAPHAAEALARSVAASGRLAGFHLHVGSMIRDVSVYDALVELLEGIYRRFPACDTLDMGGGFAVPDFPLEGFARRILPLAARHRLALVVEPGRYLTATAGTLLSRVLHVKPGDPAHVIADAGMADLLRPALYAAEHPIRRVTPQADRDPAPAWRGDVDGPLCENADRLGRDRTLDGVRPGDLLAVEQAGAYGFAMASNYASSLRPAEVVVQAGVARAARRRERPEDLWRLEDES